jgi:O-acetylhomoserine/O-acetylserine sulfhydrylase-like pyridoxal-dependent enzyme
MPYAIRSSQYVASGAASAKFTNPMEPGFQYRFVCSADVWVKVTVTGGAAAADTADNHFVAAGQPLLLANPDNSGTTNAFVHVIQQTGAGDCTLSLIEPV